MKGSFEKRIYALMTDRKPGIVGIIWTVALLPFTWLYRLGLIVRGMLFDNGTIPSYRSARKVISVGNITLGGTGKTPVILYLARYFRKRLLSAAVITRGYMTEEGAQSDEVSMLQEILPGLPVYEGADRAFSMQKAEMDRIVEVFLLDDGFQNWQIERDLDIVVLDASNPFGNGHLLPRGVLREPVSALARADIVVLTHCDAGRGNIADIRRQCIKYNPTVAVIETVHDAVGVTDLFSGEHRTDLSCLHDDIGAVCAIGSPEGFRAVLEGLGGRVGEFMDFMDHHVYTPGDVENIAARYRKKGIRKIVTTHKDAVKLRPFRDAFAGFEVLVLDIEIRIANGENEFLTRIDRLFHS